MLNRRFLLGAVVAFAAISVGCGDSTSVGAPDEPSSEAVLVSPSQASAIDVPTVTADEVPLGTNHREVSDDSYESIVSMAAAADIVVVTEVIDTKSLGRPDLAEDPYADEYLALTMHVEEALSGESPPEVTIAWDAYNVGPDGTRVAKWIANGLPTPAIGDRLVLFLRPVDEALSAHLSSELTHQPVALDGVVFLDGNRISAVETHSSVAGQLLGMDVADLRSVIAG